MKRLIPILVFVIGFSLVGCVFRQQTTQKVDKGMHVVRAAIVETAKLLQASFDGGLIGLETYTKYRGHIELVRDKYNLLLTLRDPSAEDINLLVEELTGIQDAIRGE